MMMMAIALSTVLVSNSLDTPRSYEDCVAIVEADAEAGRAYAEAWERDGVTRETRHCRAIAAIALGASGWAGAVLTELADGSVEEPGLAARFYVQAAEAFLDAGMRDEAFAAMRRAYRNAPDNQDIHMTAAAVYATAEEWEGAMLAITALERHADLSADAYALRGRANFELNRFEDAAEDTARALSLAPLLVDALVLRGDLMGVGVSVPLTPSSAPARR